MVRNSVETELGEKNPLKHGDLNAQNGVKTGGQGSSTRGTSESVPASQKQINYLLSLASRRGITPQQIAAQNNVANVDQLTKRQCSTLIEQWKVA